MASLAEPLPVARSDHRFFMISAILMALTIVAGFSTQLAMGRSSFSAPLLLHAHAVVFMGWVVLYVLQTLFATTGQVALHRRLGWIGAVWVVAMLVLGCAVTVAVARRGAVPFFFRPAEFLIFDPMTLFAFAGLTAAAVILRRRTDWHRRLHLCGMTILLGPAFGRLLPMPLLQPLAFEAAFVAPMIFPVAGAIADVRRSGRVHPAWWWGIGSMLVLLMAIELLTHSALGNAIYAAVTAGSPGAALDPQGYRPPPSGPLITGR